MRDVANARIASVSRTVNDTVGLYNKTLRRSNNPFSIIDRGIKPDVQVFRKVDGRWRRIGLPVEVESAGNGAAVLRNIDKYGTPVGKRFNLETY